MSEIFDIRLAREEIARLESELDDSRKIVNRIWAIYGSPSYESLAGKSIYELIENDRTRMQSLEKELRFQRSNLPQRQWPTIDKALGDSP